MTNKPPRGPDPTTLYPLHGYQRLCFLKNLIDHPQIEVGAYTYYDDFESVDNFLANVRYLFDFSGDRLLIGKCCMIASGVEFIMNGANHLSDAISTYPFAIFGQGREGAMKGWAYPMKGDTRIGNDVWIGYRAMILPGVTIGDGAVVGGHPARVIRFRFFEAEIDRLLALKWWDWPPGKITRCVHLLTGKDLAALEREAEKENG